MISGSKLTEYLACYQTFLSRIMNKRSKKIIRTLICFLIIIGAASFLAIRILEPKAYKGWHMDHFALAELERVKGYDEQEEAVAYYGRIRLQVEQDQERQCGAFVALGLRKTEGFKNLLCLTDFQFDRFGIFGHYYDPFFKSSANNPSIFSWFRFKAVSFFPNRSSSRRVGYLIFRKSVALTCVCPLNKRKY